MKKNKHEYLQMANDQVCWTLVVIGLIILVVWWCNSQKSRKREGLKGASSGGLSESDACCAFAGGLEGVCLGSLGYKTSKRCLKEYEAFRNICPSLSKTKYIDTDWCEEFFKGMQHGCKEYASDTESCLAKAKVIYKQCRE